MIMLTLPLKSEYFDQIKCGDKLEEYRLVTPFWSKRLEGKSFDIIVLTKWYPHRSDTTRRLFRPWRGFRKAQIQHPHFGPKPVEVYAIRVN